MKIRKLQISKEKTDINLQFYFFLKHIVKLKPSDTQVFELLENLMLLKASPMNIILEALIEVFTRNSKKTSNKYNEKLEQIKEIASRFNVANDVELFIFALNIYQIKDLLLQEAKISENTDIKKLEHLDVLSLEYDKISIIKPYTTRVNGALLSLLFFEKLENGETNFMSEDAHQFVLSLSTEAKRFKEQGLESNQIFMLMFSEAIDQSIISDSGGNYESRILSVLNKSGITNITKDHDKNDKSTEFDFFFEIEGRTYGIGAKRTLRERYKQFIKTALTSKIDVMIEITLGLDLNEEKAKTITSHGTYIFVANEIYEANEFLQKLEKVYPAKELNIKTLKSLK